jgi:hypothetical protein
MAAWSSCRTSERHDPLSPYRHQTILKVLVGPHTHGPAGLERDKDFRSAFVMPTADMFQLWFKYDGVATLIAANRVGDRA